LAAKNSSSSCRLPHCHQSLSILPVSALNIQSSPSVSTCAVSH
jgi:hypothetical protein